MCKLKTTWSFCVGWKLWKCITLHVVIAQIKNEKKDWEFSVWKNTVACCYWCSICIYARMECNYKVLPADMSKTKRTVNLDTRHPLKIIIRTQISIWKAFAYFRGGIKTLLRSNINSSSSKRQTVDMFRLTDDFVKWKTYVSFGNDISTPMQIISYDIQYIYTCTHCVCFIGHALTFISC